MKNQSVPAFLRGRNPWDTRRGFPQAQADGGFPEWISTISRTARQHWGLPEIPFAHRFVGYRSLPKEVAEFPIAVRLDWPRPRQVDEVRLYPVGRLLGANTDAAGFPPEVRIDSWNETKGTWNLLVKKSGERMESPGLNPVPLRFAPVETRRIRLIFPRLWKATERSAAILALTEIEPRFRGQALEGAELVISDQPQDGPAVPNQDGTDRFRGAGGLERRHEPGRENHRRA